MASEHESSQKISIVLESRGVAEAEQRFVAASRAVEKFADALDASVGRIAGSPAEAAKRAGSEVKKFGAKAEGVGASVGKFFAKLTTEWLDPVRIASDLAARGISFVGAKLAGAAAQGWEVNAAYERATSRIQGLVQGLVDWTGLDPTEKATRAHAVSLELVRRYKRVALEAALPYEAIELAAARLNPTLSGLGKTQKDVLEFTRLSANAATVYGENAAEAAKIVSKAMFAGVVEGESAFAMAFKQMAGVSSKMGVEERMRRIQKVLSDMGAPMSAVTTGTESQYLRWKQLSEDVLQRVTAPVYDRIGKSIADGVGWLDKHSDKVDELSAKVGEYVAKWDSFAQSVEGVDRILGGLSKMAPTNSLASFLWDAGGAAVDVLDFIAAGAGAVGDLIGDLLVDGPMRRWEMATLRVRILFDEVQESIGKIVGSMARAPWDSFWGGTGVGKRVSGWLGEKTSGWFGLKGEAAGAAEAAKTARISRLAELERELGVESTTKATAALRALEEGRAKKAAEDIANRPGVVVNQNIAKVEVHNDLRGEDPDLIVEFARDLEKLGERAYQVSLGGASVFGPGG